MSNARYAILGDIHSNWEALSAVLKDAAEQHATGYVCVGDVVGYNASPIECLEKVRELKFVCVRGNHDHYCSHDEHLGSFHPLAAVVINWTRSQLSPEQCAWLKHLPYLKTAENFTIVHATLDMPEKWAYMFDDLDAITNFTYQVTPVCFHGHTHVPIVFRGSNKVTTMPFTKMKIERGHKYFVNVGSVGQPRDGDPRAAYATYDMKTREIELRRVAYDVETAQSKIIDVGLPKWLAERLPMGR